MLLYLGIGGYYDRWAKLFGGHKHCYNGDLWPAVILSVDYKFLAISLFCQTSDSCSSAGEML